MKKIFAVFFFGFVFSAAAADYVSGTKKITFYNYGPTNDVYLVTDELITYRIPFGTSQAELEVNIYVDAYWSISDIPGVYGSITFPVILGENVGTEKELFLCLAVGSSGASELRWYREEDRYSYWEIFNLSVAAALLVGLSRFVVTLVVRFKPKTTQVIE